MLLIIISGIYLFAQKDTGETTSKTAAFGEEEAIVYLGNENAENEVLLAFDYSCPHCHRWIKEVFPELEPLIEKGTVKLRTQSMVYLNENSLRLSKLDQNLKKNQPNEYFNLFFKLMDDENIDNWGTDTYIEELVEEFHLNSEKLLSEPNIDVINITRAYTKNLEIEYVPTIFVNEKKVEDPFSIKEIVSNFK